MAITKSPTVLCTPPTEYCGNPAEFAWEAPLANYFRTHYRCLRHVKVDSKYGLVDMWSGTCYRHKNIGCMCWSYDKKIRG